MRSLLSLALLVGFVPPAFGACHFKTADAVVCVGYLGSRNAALAYHEFGPDPSAVQPPYVRDVLREAECIVLSEQAPRMVPVQEMARFNVPLPDGYVEVSRLMVMAGIKPVIYVARDYLEGTCERYVPPVITTGPQTSWKNLPDDTKTPE